MKLSEVRKGTRVVMTTAARQEFKGKGNKPGWDRGRVMSNGLNAFGSIRILRDGYKCPESWSPSFWIVAAGKGKQ